MTILKKKGSWFVVDGETEREISEHIFTVKGFKFSLLKTTETPENTLDNK